MIYKNILETIGNTPIVQINSFNTGNMFVKLEKNNPGGSVKDRPALHMILQAEKRGDLKKGQTIIEPTSGNTGVGIAMVAAVKGYEAIFTMPETMTVERRKILQAYGAQIILTDGAKGMAGAVEKAKQLQEEYGYFMPQQFENFDNSDSHRQTADEIWNDMNGDIDILVCAVGTGGTLSGTGKFLREKNPNMYTVGMEPENSAVISGEEPGPHKIYGTGAGFIPEILEKNFIDELLKVANEHAFNYAKILSSKEGILAGVSCGAVLWCMHQVAQKPENRNKKILGILPDTGERYLSVDGLF